MATAWLDTWILYSSTEKRRKSSGELTLPDRLGMQKLQVASSSIFVCCCFPILDRFSRAPGCCYAPSFGPQHFIALSTCAHCNNLVDVSNVSGVFWLWSGIRSHPQHNSAEIEIRSADSAEDWIPWKPALSRMHLKSSWAMLWQCLSLPQFWSDMEFCFLGRSLFVTRISKKEKRHGKGSKARIRTTPASPNPTHTQPGPGKDRPAADSRRDSSGFLALSGFAGKGNRNTPALSRLNERSWNTS